MSRQRGSRQEAKMSQDWRILDILGGGIVRFERAKINIILQVTKEDRNFWYDKLIVEHGRSFKSKFLNSQI